MYDRAWCHFLQTDPVGYDDDLNLYAYVRNDPLNFFDSEGSLRRDQDGRLIFRRRGEPYDERHPGAPARRYRVQPGYLLTDDGRRVEALRNLSRDPGFDCNCHGRTFADSAYWIQPSQVDTILEGDGYTQVETPEVGDVAVYRNGRGEAVHSGAVVGVDSESGEASILSEGGLEVEPRINPATPGPGGAWHDPSATLEFYRKEEEVPTGTRLRR